MRLKSMLRACRGEKMMIMSNWSNTYDNKARYLNPLTDYGFKRVFGEKDIMIAFLTDLLEPKSPIKDIIFIDKELVPERSDLHGVVYDLRCMTEDGGEFIVEMQNKTQYNFSDRILFYLSRSFSTQEPKGEWDYELRPVYGVFFINFHLKGLKPQSIRTIRLKVDETGEVFSEKLRAYTLELPDYKNKPTDVAKSPIEYWLYNLVNMGSMTTDLPFQDRQPIFQKVGGVSEIAKLTPSEYAQYDKSLNIYRTSLSAMKYAVDEGFGKGVEKGIEQGKAIGREEGKAIGREEGKEEGKKQAQLENARKMKADGMPIDLIQKYSGLTAEEIAGLD